MIVKPENMTWGVNMPRQDFLTGRLLIAMPNMGDPRFERSVVLICAHDENHAMGVVVNKPLPDIKFSELLDQLSIAPRQDVANSPVYFGGPVKSSRGVVLHSLDYRLGSTVEVAPNVGLTVTPEILTDIAGIEGIRPPPEKSMLAIGHAGWGAGQLESEIKQNSWAYCDASADLIFSEDVSAMWRGAFSTIGVTEAMFSGEWTKNRPEGQLLN